MLVMHQKLQSIQRVKSTLPHAYERGIRETLFFILLKSILLCNNNNFHFQRNYGCDVCSKHFTNASDLTKHKRIHDPDSKIACKYCDRKFAQRVNYRNHLRSNHPMEDIPAAKDSKKVLGD